MDSDNRRGKGVSLLPVQIEGLKELAFLDGHLNTSRVLQGLLDRELTRRFGAEWPKRYESRSRPIAETSESVAA